MCPPLATYYNQYSLKMSCAAVNAARAWSHAKNAIVVGSPTGLQTLRVLTRTVSSEMGIPVSAMWRVSSTPGPRTNESDTIGPNLMRSVRRRNVPANGGAMRNSPAELLSARATTVEVESSN
jgi:hypothetical protein